MDMYRILENFDAVNSKQTLVEGQMKRQLEARAEQMSKADFVADAGEYGMKPEEAAEFWIAVNGGDEDSDYEDVDHNDDSHQYSDDPLDEERRSEEEWDAQALAQHKAKLAREKQKIAMQRKISGQDSGEPPVVRDMSEAGEAFTKGDRVMYLNGFATVVGQDGDSYVVKVDGQPAAMKVPASAIKKPSYDESKHAKPDFLDMDQDGDKQEPMKKAVKDKNDARGSFQKQMGGSARDLTKGLSIGTKKVDEVFPGTPEYELRFGKDDASSAFDKKKISTGTVYSRRYQDEPEADDDTPKSAGRPKGTGRKLGAKGPSVSSKLLKGKGGLKEQDIDIQDRGEYDREGDMALNQVHQIADAARELHAILASDDNLPEWVQSKITKALDYIDTARDYLDAEGEMDREAMGEAGYSAKAARAGKDIGKPGKNFSKIAKGAAERYGSKAAGERVAGAVLAKLRAKEGVEEADKKDVPFDGPYRKKGDDKDQFGNKIKHVARHAARQGIADMTTAELKAELKRRSQVEEESTDTQDQHAEKAGKRVTKDLEYDMKHKGKDDAKAEKAGKKVTKDIEYDDKKDKKKEVEETTVSGSVAPAAGGDAPKKGKGGMQFGKGVYEGQLDELDKSTLGSYVKKATKDVEGKASEKQQYKDMFAGDFPVRGAKKEVQKKQADIDKRVGGIGKAVDRLTKEGVYEGQVAESFEKKLGSILNEGMSVNVSTDDTGKKSISVNATDADADALGDMLKMAGLFSSEGYSRACTDCGGIHEMGACGADMVEEELANSPDEVYADADYMTQTLSGGLNGPKTTGQTTGPVVNRQDSRQGVMAEAERVKEAAESRLWNLYKKI